MRGKLDNTLAAMFSHIDYSHTYLFYAHIISQCHIKIDKTLPAPAGVLFNIDHYVLYINPNFFDLFNLPGRLAILKHETLHILYNHVGRQGNKIHEDWNEATDCAINQHINIDHLPEVGILPHKLEKKYGAKFPINKASETYYDIIKENKKNTNNQSPKSGQGEGGTPMDSHSLWEKSSVTNEIQSEVTKKMMETARETTSRKNGEIPAEYGDWLEIFSSKSEVSWETVLKRVTGRKKIGKRKTIKKPHRRFPNRKDLRGTQKNKTFNLLIVADVSGSMSDVAILKTLAEVKHICKMTNTSIDLVQIDTVPHTPEKLTKNTKVIKRKGNGGTILFSAVQKARDYNIDVDAVVVLTDGYVSSTDVDNFGSLGVKVIWLVEPSGTIPDRLPTKNMPAFKLEKK